MIILKIGPTLAATVWPPKSQLPLSFEVVGTRYSEDSFLNQHPRLSYKPIIVMPLEDDGSMPAPWIWAYTWIKYLISPKLFWVTQAHKHAESKLVANPSKGHLKHNLWFSSPPYIIFSEFKYNDWIFCIMIMLLFRENWWRWCAVCLSLHGLGLSSIMDLVPACALSRYFPYCYQYCI